MTAPRKVVVFGNGPWGELVRYCIDHDSPHEVVAFTADRNYVAQESVGGVPVVAFDEVERHFPPADHAMVLPLSYQRMNRLREERYHQARAKGYELITYVSSTATTFPDLEIGDNCFVSETTVLHPFVRIGNNVVIGANVVIGHHCVIEDHVFIAPGAVILGECRIGAHSLIGTNSSVHQGTNVAPGTMLGMGVAVNRDTKPEGVYLQRPPDMFSKPSSELQLWMTWDRDRD